MTIKNILAVRNDRFGEFLLIIPALRALKQRFPGSKLILAVNPYVVELAKCVEQADEVFSWENKKHTFSQIFSFSKELKRKGFDLMVVFNPSRELHMAGFLAGIPLRLGYNHKWPFFLTHKLEDKKYLGEKHEIEYNLELAGLIGASTEDKSLSLRINNDIITSLKKEFDFTASRELLALHPWTSDPLKQWPIENFARLAIKLEKELKKTIVIIGGKEEIDRGSLYFDNLGPGIVNLSGKTSLIQLTAVLKRCQLLISGDSGPVHLACCAGIPVAALFRNDLPGKGPVRWGPVSKGSEVIEKPVLSDISVEEVFDTVQRVLKR